MNSTRLEQYFPCCEVTEYPPTPQHWDFYITKHLDCIDDTPEVPADRDRLTEHDERISKAQTVWALRLIVAVVTTMLMVGMHVTGAFPYQWAGIGCVFFVAVLYFLEHTPKADRS